MRVAITINPTTNEGFITCPFEHDPEGAGLVFEDYFHPDDFLHTFEGCTGVVPLAEYLVWLGQQVGKGMVSTVE